MNTRSIHLPVIYLCVTHISREPDHHISFPPGMCIIKGPRKWRLGLGAIWTNNTFNISKLLIKGVSSGRDASTLVTLSISTTVCSPQLPEQLILQFGVLRIESSFTELWINKWTALCAAAVVRLQSSAEQFVRMEPATGVTTEQETAPSKQTRSERTLQLFS